VSTVLGDSGNRNTAKIWTTKITLTAIHLKFWEWRLLCMPHRMTWSWYTGRWCQTWWVGCYIWYSEEGTGRSPSQPRLLFAVPNVIAHPSTACVLCTCTNHACCCLLLYVYTGCWPLTTIVIFWLLRLIKYSYLYLLAYPMKYPVNKHRQHVPVYCPSIAELPSTY